MTILFVDDERPLLDGLRAVLRRYRREWSMEFVTSGAEALRALGQSRFDVVVSDMRMPGMDGAELFERVRAEYPATVRIILSGQSDQTSVFKALGCTHQFLAKPLDPETLPRVIQRATSLRDALDDRHRAGLMSRCDDLPAPPALYFQLHTAMADPRATVRDIAALIERDPGCATSLLRLTSSSYFGLARPAQTVLQAVQLLGLELVSSVVLTAGLFRSSPPKVRGFCLESLRRHAHATALAARAIAGDGPAAEQAYVAGLVHEIGHLVKATAFPEDMLCVLEHGQDDVPVETTARAILGYDHTALGAYLLGVWGLPAAIVDAVACQNTPALFSAAQDQRPATIDAATAVHVADALVARSLSPMPLMRDSVELDRDHLARHGWLDRLPSWEARVAQILAEVPP